MRKDLRPHWLKKAWEQLNRGYVDWRIKPQLDSVGKDFRVMYPRHLQLSGPNIHVGDHVHMMALYDRPIRLAVFEGLGQIRIGDYSIVNPGVRISSANSIEIGQSCMLAMNAYLSDADWHDTQHRIFAPGATGPIRLRENAWIGESALVSKHVTVGVNSIVGAYSVVTKDVADNTIVAGVPARKIGEVDPADIISRQSLFTGNQSYETFEHNYHEQLLKGNSFAHYLKSLILPGKSD